MYSWMLPFIPQAFPLGQSCQRASGCQRLNRAACHSGYTSECNRADAWPPLLVTSKRDPSHLPGSLDLPSAIDLPSATNRSLGSPVCVASGVLSCVDLGALSLRVPTCLRQEEKASGLSAQDDILPEGEMSGDEAVPDSANREQMAGRGGVFFDIAPQPDDKVINGARVRVFAQVPDILENRFARNGLTLAADQVAQELRFHQGELNSGVARA